ncbi:MAG: hypothetical protein JSV23_03575 [Promethearchaeota archaeon]|nr:MAG: hypothetical protein JSV23_03575 [Candidatus Lokiarchaeota archaeon]
MLKFTINEFLDLRLEDGKTNIYVNNELFMHCKHILLTVPLDEIDDFNSVDEFIERSDKHYEFSIDYTIEISPETRFWVHCSNIQAWYENNYNTCLIHSNLAFPLLNKLKKAGDFLAGKVFKEEVAKRFENGNLNVIQFFLYNHYLDCLNKEELELLLEQASSNLTINIVNQLNELLSSTLSNFRKIKELIELVLFLDLKYNQNLIFRVFNELNENLKNRFARLLILHLNYKEFINYKIPYGKFFTYFEEILNFLYEKYPEINDLLKIIDSGFISGAVSLDEKFSYGAVSYHRIIQGY